MSVVEVENMADLAELRRLVTYCGGFCGNCGIYRGRVVAKVAADLKELIDGSQFAEWVPVYEDIDFSFSDFEKGLEFFSDGEAGPYCQHPCKEGGGPPCQIRPCAREKGLRCAFSAASFRARSLHGSLRGILTDQKTTRDSSNLVGRGG